MTRTNIDYGIDLGTTNSEIAVYEGGAIVVLKNDDNHENTPSAVWYDKDGVLEVGKLAKERHEHEPDDAKIEFKRQMGSDRPILFKSSGRSLLPEEASAEVLKQLRVNAQVRRGEEINAAVITVPADFKGAQTDATYRAAQLAGFVTSPLLQEPAAAAIAYGFQDDTRSAKRRWLVYDFGGGTFDAAIVQNDDGLIRVEGCGGDKELGGKDIDYAIVQTLLVPPLMKQMGLKDFNRNNPVWRNVFGSLKSAAEEAKIRLSSRQTTRINLHSRSQDEQGKWVEIDFEYELTRQALEAIVEPVVAKTIYLCKAELARKRLSPSAIDKLILVGGPTLMPRLREMLKDEVEGLGIPLEFSVDPFTVVARGAAVFAATQPLPRAAGKIAKAGEYDLELDHKAIGPDEEPIVSGRLIGEDGEDLKGFTIEFINRDARPPWRSGKIGLSPDGSFLVTLWAERGPQNIFEIELVNSSGTRQGTHPGSIGYMVRGGGLDTQALIHNIGVGLSDNTVGGLHQEGAPLPTSWKQVKLMTDRTVRKGGNEAIRISLLEGKEARADRNQLFEAIVLPAKDFVRDVPVGSEIQLRAMLDESRNCFVKIYVPLLDEEFEMKLERKNLAIDPADLRRDVEQEKERLASVRVRVAESADGEARGYLQRVDAERLEQSVDDTLEAALGDEDAVSVAASRLRDLQLALDRTEARLRRPALAAEANELIDQCDGLVAELGDAEEKDQAATLIAGLRRALEGQDDEILAHCSDEVRGFTFRMILRRPEGIMLRYQLLSEQRDQMTSQAEADRLINQGRIALQAGDHGRLGAVNNELADLLPPGVEERAYEGSTVLSSGR